MVKTNQDSGSMKQVMGNQQLTVSDEETIDVVNYKWRRLNNETAKQYSYFKMYLQLPIPRKIDRLAKQLRMASGQGLRSYSAKLKWLERAAAYDEHILDKEIEQKRRQRDRIDLEWLDRREELRQDEWKVGKELLARVKQMLAVPLFRQRVEETIEGLDRKGRIILKQIIINEPLDWSPSDMAKFFEVASKMMRLATGMETDRKKIKIDVSTLSDEQLEELIQGG